MEQLEYPVPGDGKCRVYNIYVLPNDPPILTTVVTRWINEIPPGDHLPRIILLVGSEMEWKIKKFEVVHGFESNSVVWGRDLDGHIPELRGRGGAVDIVRAVFREVLAVPPLITCEWKDFRFNWEQIRTACAHVHLHCARSKLHVRMSISTGPQLSGRICREKQILFDHLDQFLRQDVPLQLGQALRPLLQRTWI